MKFALPWLALGLLAGAAFGQQPSPNIVFVMADDMGWGQTGYRNHPVLKTPNLDAMAAAGLRFDRFYAGAPVCSPTRASVLTGRANHRTGVLSHGYALRLQEKTIAQALRADGYVTGHFGKWHLNGLRGPGVPVLAADHYHPGVFGFDEWLSVTNYFDVNPTLSRGGKFEEFQGDSSEIVVAEAVKFLAKHREGGKPMFAVVWFGSPHSPFKALPEDKAKFAELDALSASHYAELAAMDRGLGTLRQGLRDLGIADNTLLVFCSDNGGLAGITPETVGGLRGNKGTVYEGGLRVPGIIEWPAVITPRVTNYPACTMDLFPTVADILDMPKDVFVQPLDGVSLRPLFAATASTPASPTDQAGRTQPIPFRYGDKLAMVDNRYKLLTNDLNGDSFELYDLEADPKESHDLSTEQPERFRELKAKLVAWNETVEASVKGKDYAAGKLTTPDPRPQAWSEVPGYQPYLEQWKSRPEYRRTLEQAGSGKPAKPAKKPKEAK